MKSHHLETGDDFLLRLQELASRLLDDLAATTPDQVKRATPSLLLTSAYPGEGKTSLSFLIARQMALISGKRILLVDANFIRPRLTEHLNLSHTHGFADILQGEGKTDPCVFHDAGNRVAVLGAGNAPDAGLLSRSALIEDFKMSHGEQFRAIVFDGPTVRQGGSFLARGSDGVLLVIDSTATRREVVKGAVESIKLAPGSWLGCVLNKRLLHIPNFLYEGL